MRHLLLAALIFCFPMASSFGNCICQSDAVGLPACPGLGGDSSECYLDGWRSCGSQYQYYCYWQELSF